MCENCKCDPIDFENAVEAICGKGPISGMGLLSGGLTSGTVFESSLLHKPHTIVSCTLTSEGTIEVIRQYPSNMSYLTYPGTQAPDTVIKEIYGSVNGKIELIKQINGRHTPAHTVPESFDFDEE